MGLSDFKITDADITSKGVQASPDQLSGTAEDNKKVFDRLTSGPVRDGHNKLIDALVALGVEQLIQYGSEDIKYIRLNADEHIEVSSDGATWTEVASSGHLIYDAAGQQMPQRSRLKFGGASVVSDDGTYTIVSGVKGDKGETGAKGDKGEKGDTGDQGPRGAAWYPAVDGLGNLTFVLSETATPPPAYNIRGPQGPQGVQGLQGAAGATGPQGIQGPRGLQGAKGEKGATGATGATGPAGPTGPQGQKGDPGEDGKSFTIQDIYPTLAALKQAFPTGNEYAYQVTAEDDEIFIWSELATDWVSLGKLQGPQGPQGPTGATGATGPTGPTGPEGPEGPQGPQGETGPQGEQGIQGPQGEAGESAYTAASKGGYTGTETQFNSDLAKIGNKADKTVPAAAGNLAALDAAGNLSDSGKKVGDFQTKVTASGLLKGDGAGGVTAAAAGTDYSGPKATVTATMLASGWTGSEAPFVYTLAIAGVTATSYQELLPAVNITAEQLKALQAANITDAGQAAGTMTLKAYGKKPTVDIPIRVIKEGE